MSFSSTSVFSRIPSMISSFQYMSTDSILVEDTEDEISPLSAEPEVTLTERSLAERLAVARGAGFAEAETKFRQQFEQQSARETNKISGALENFDREQRNYFARVEAEVVQLALAIAGKILHREAQVDPMLVAAIVHLSLGQLKDGSAATIRVRPGRRKSLAGTLRVAGYKTTCKGNRRRRA